MRSNSQLSAGRHRSTLHVSALALLLGLAGACDESDTCTGSVPSCAAGTTYSDAECSCSPSPDGGTSDAQRGLPPDAARDALPSADSGAPNALTGIAFVPADLTTNVSTTQLGVSVYQYSAVRSRPEVLSDLASALELVTWPSAERVAADIRVDPTLPVYMTQVLLTPQQALTDGWYALRLSPPPANVRFGVAGSTTRDGISMARFRVGSQPMIQRIELCAKSDARTKLVITTSETVRQAEAGARSVIVTADSVPVSCEPAEFASAPGGTAGLSTLCTVTTSVAKLELRVEGLVGTSGLALSDGAGAAPSYVVVPTSLPETGGCRQYVPPTNEPLR